MSKALLLLGFFALVNFPSFLSADSVKGDFISSKEALVLDDTPTVSNPNPFFFVCVGETDPVVNDLRAFVSSGQPINFYSVATGGSPLSNNGILLDGTTYYADDGAGARAAITPTVIVQPQFNPDSAIQTFCASEGATVGDLSTIDKNGNTLQISWYLGENDLTPLTPSQLLPLGQNEIWAAQFNPGKNCESKDRTLIIVSVYQTPTAPPSAPSPQTFCTSSTPTIADLQATPSQSINILQWYSVPAGGSSLPDTTPLQNGTTYYVQQVAPGCGVSDRAAVLVQISPTPNAGSPIATNPTYRTCRNETDPASINLYDLIQGEDAEGGDIVGFWSDLSASGALAGSTVNLQTLRNKNSVETTLFTYRYTIRNNISGCEATSTVTIKVDDFKNPGTPVTPPYAVCFGAVPSTLNLFNRLNNETAGGTWTGNAQTAPFLDSATGILNILNLRDNLGAGTYNFTYSFAVNGDCPAGSSTVSVTIYPAPNAPAVTTLAPACQGVTLNANDALNPAGQTVVWYNAATGGSQVANPTLSTPGTVTYYAEASDGNSCRSLSRTAVTLEIYAAPALPNASDKIECETNPIQTLTATATNVPAGVTITWYDAPTGGNVVANPTWNQIGSITYYAEAKEGTNQCVSTQRKAVKLEIVGAPAAPTATSPQVACMANGLVLTATATPPNGSIVVWYDQASGGNVVVPSINSVGTATFYAASRTNNSAACESFTRTRVDLEIKPTPSISLSDSQGPTSCGNTDGFIKISVSGITIADGTTVTFDYNGGQLSGPSQSNIVTLSNLDNGSYSNITLTRDGCPSNSLNVNLADPNSPVLSIFQVNNPTACDANNGSIIINVTGVAIADGPVTFNFNGTSRTGQSLNNRVTFSGLVAGSYTNISYTIAGCTSNFVNATLSDPIPVISASANNPTSCGGSNGSINLLISHTPDGNYTVTYTDNNGPQSVNVVVTSGTASITGLSQGSYSNIKISVGTCTSADGVNVTLVDPSAPSAPTVSGNITECPQNPIQTLNANSSLNPSGQNVIWYNAANGGNVVANPILNSVGSITYYAETVAASTGCTSASRTAVTLTINAAPAAPTVTGNITECALSSIQTLNANTALSPAGQNVIWFDAVSGGNQVANPTLNSLGSVTYFAQAVDGNSCNSLSRTAVTLTLNAIPSLSLNTSDNQDPTNCGANDGSFKILVQGVTLANGLVNFTFDGGNLSGNSVSNLVTFSNLSSGAYNNIYLTIAGCESNKVSTELFDPASPSIAITNKIDPFACGQSSGQIQIAVSGVTLSNGQTVTFNYGGGSLSGTSQNNVVIISSLSAGSYNNITLTINNCTSNAVSTSLSDPSSAQLGNPIPANPSACGESDGQIVIPISGVTLTDGDTINVLYSGGVLVGQITNGGTSILITSLGAGSYMNMQVFLNGCTSNTVSTQLQEPTAPNAPTVSGDPAACWTDGLILNANNALNPSTQNVVWYTAAVGGSVVNNPTQTSVGSSTYYAEAVNSGSGCVSSSRTAVTLTIYSTPSIAISQNTACSVDLSSYSLKVSVSSGTVTSTAGIVTQESSLVWAIQDVPIGTNIIVTVSDVNSCQAELPITSPSCACGDITPPVSGGDQAECVLDPIQNLTATATVPAGFSIQWYDSNGNLINDPSWNQIGTITYYAEAVESSSNCTSTERTPVSLTINPLPNANITAQDIICESEPLQPIEDGGDAVSWLWTTNGSATFNNNTLQNPILYGIQKGETITVQIRDANGCVSQTSKTIDVQSAPFAGNALEPFTLCETNVTQTNFNLFNLLDGTQQSGGVWTDSDGMVVNQIVDLTILAPGTYVYTYTITAGATCSDLIEEDSEEVYIIIDNNAEAGVGQDYDICESSLNGASTLNLFNQLVGADPGGYWLDDNDSGALLPGGIVDLNVLEPSLDYSFTYVVIGGDTCANPADVENVIVKVTEELTAGTGFDLELCKGGIGSNSRLNLFSQLEGYDPGGDWTELTNSGALSGSQVALFFLDEGEYIFRYTVNEGTACEIDFTDVKIIIRDAETPILLLDDLEFCLSDNAQLSDITFEGNPDIIWYADEDSSLVLSPETSLKDGETYYVVAVDPESRCESSRRLAVPVSVKLCPQDIIVYDGFSPNGDNINDTFRVPYLAEAYPNFVMKVYNRFGQLIFQGDRQNPEWDGTPNSGNAGSSSVLPVGSYFYVIQFNDGIRAPLQGTVYLNQ